MHNVVGLGRRLGSYIKKTWFVFLMLGVYVFFCAYYMGPGFMKCSDSIYGFGDSTAGPIWRNSIKPDQPLFGGPETNTNYPYGESLYSPVSYAASVQTIAMGLTSKVVGPVCAYNLYNITGYALTAVAMCLFVWYLTRNKWIALIAGYAVSFAPYVQSKVGGHPSYGYSAVLIGLLWLFLHLVKTKKTWVAVVFGSLLALCAYFDPYFTLLAATIVGPAFLAWLMLSLWKRRHRIGKADNLKTYIRPMLIAALAFSLCLAPLIAIRIKDAGVIEATVGKSRGDLRAAAMLCSNTPLDYLLPDPTNIHLVSIIGSDYTANNIGMRHWCGPGESRVSVSLTLCLISIVGGVIYIIQRTRKRQDSYRIHGYDTKLVLAILLVVGLIAFWAGMPPRYGGLPMLSALILKVTTMWRIFAREFLVVNLVLVVSASIALAYLVSLMKRARWPRWSSYALLLAALVGVIFEYQINDPFSPITFSYERDVPSVYRTIKNTQSINVIAEYPLDRIGLEHDSVVYYMTMQAVHGKKLFNSVLANDSKESEHISLKDLSDPQTLPALRYLGINTITVHGESINSIKTAIGADASLIESDRPVVYSLKMVREDSDPTVALLSLRPGRKLSNILAITKGYAVNLPNIQSPLASEYELLNNGTMTVLPLMNDKVKSAPMCFDVKMAAKGDAGLLSIRQGSQVILERPISDAYKPVRVIGSTGDVFTVANDKGFNMRINNLNAGCGEQI